MRRPMVIAAVALLAACGGDDEQQADTATEATGSEPGAATTVARGAETPEESGSSPLADIEDATCTYLGTNFLGSMQVETAFTNPLGDVPSIEITYTLLDGADGTRFFTSGRQYSMASANEQFRITDSTGSDLPPNLDETTIDCQVLAIEAAGSNQEVELPTEADTCTVVEPGASSGDIEVELSVTSPFVNIGELHASYALYGPGPVRFTQFGAGMDLVGEGETVQIFGSAYTETPKWVGDSEVTCKILGFWTSDF